MKRLKVEVAALVANSCRQPDCRRMTSNHIMSALHMAGLWSRPLWCVQHTWHSFTAHVMHKAAVHSTKATCAAQEKLMLLQHPAYLVVAFLLDARQHSLADIKAHALVCQAVRRLLQHQLGDGGNVHSAQLPEDHRFIQPVQ